VVSLSGRIQATLPSSKEVIIMERIRTISGTGPVFVDSNSVGHCAFEINVYKDSTGRVTGRGHVMGDSAILGKMSYGQRVEISESENGHKFQLVAGGWAPGERTMEVETGPDVIH
jgi:hypothetical protein